MDAARGTRSRDDSVRGAAIIVDREVRIALESLTDIEPLHMPPALAGIDAVSHEFPAATQVTAFDTVFHAGMPEAVMMATRCGSVDAGLLLHLQSHQGIGVAELLDVLESRSGLLGVSGVSPDLRRVLEAAAAGAPRARLAYDRFVLSLRRAVGSMAGVPGGVDALVFTGGIGENSARVRADVADSLQFTGLRLSRDADQSSVPDRVISAPDSAVALLVVHAREDLMVLDEVLRLTDVTAAPQ